MNKNNLEKIKKIDTKIEYFRKMAPPFVTISEKSTSVKTFFTPKFYQIMIIPGIFVGIILNDLIFAFLCLIFVFFMEHVEDWISKNQDEIENLLIERKKLVEEFGEKI